MRTILYRYYRWRAMRTEDFDLMWYYDNKANEVLNR